METSKRLLWTFVYFLIISIVLVGISDIAFGTSLGYLLSYSVPVSTSVILAYIGKSGFENVTKIKTGPLDGFLVESNGTSIEAQPSVILGNLTESIQTPTPTPTQSAMGEGDA
jgi:hypothetical protein